MRIIIIILLLFISKSIFPQKIGNIDNKAIHFELKHKNDTIDFIVVDTILTKKKPIFLFCQGSMPIPLFFEFENNRLFMFGGGISNFDIASITKHYHLVVVSMPKTPLISNVNHMNKSYCYIPDTTQKDKFKQDFLHSDYMDNYVERASVVLKYLKQQQWVDNDVLIVAGHSQGSKIATVLASINEDISKVGLFGANPFGRIDQMIRKERKLAESGDKTWEEAEKGIDYWYKYWERANDTVMINKYPQYIPWKSFSKPTINYLLDINVPIYLTYGTNDITSDLCDILPILFISKDKDNLTLKRQIGLEHNFFELKENGRADHNKSHWVDVMNEFIEWTVK